MSSPKPVSVHVKAMIASLVPLLFALLFSWIFPLAIFTLTRISPERVDCVVEQRVLGVIPLAPIRVDDLEGASAFEAEGNSRTGDRVTSVTPYLKLVDAGGNETLVAANGATFDELAARMRTFCSEPAEPPLRFWTVPLLGYAAAIPLMVSLLFGPLVLIDFARTLLRRG